MLPWSEKYETGHALIDSQHKALIHHINQLEEMARTTNPSRQELEFCLEVIKFMDTYIAVHFAQEENCMEACKCPVRHENRKAHSDFLRYFRQFKTRFDAEGCRPEVMSDLHRTCSAWIEQHILQIDLQIKPCLKPSEHSRPP